MDVMRLSMLRLVHRHHGLILSQLVRDERGFTLVFTAFAMSVLMGFAGLAVDVGYWQAMQQNMQGAADQAAYSAVIASGAGGGQSDNPSRRHYRKHGLYQRP